MKRSDTPPRRISAQIQAKVEKTFRKRISDSVQTEKRFLQDAEEPAREQIHHEKVFRKKKVHFQSESVQSCEREESLRRMVEGKNRQVQVSEEERYNFSLRTRRYMRVISARLRLQLRG